MNQVTLRPKEMNHMFFPLGDLVSTFWWVWMNQTLQICGSDLNKPENENEQIETNT